MSRVPGSIWVDLTATMQYNMYSNGDHHPSVQLRELLGPAPSNDEIILTQDSVSSSVLSYSIDDKYEADFAVYDSLAPTVPLPGDGPDAV